MLAYVALMLMQLPATGVAPPRPITQWIHTTWTVKEGAPTDIVALAQTKDGYLWVGTLWGVVRFDGARFVPLAPQFGDTLAPHGVRHMLGTRDGSLWIAWGGGTVTRVRNGRLTSYGPADGLPSTFKLAESSTGMLVAGTEKGLAQFADGKWKDVSQAWHFPGKGTRVVWFDHEDALWAATESRFVYRPAGTDQFLNTDVALSGLAVGSFAEAADGTVWTSVNSARTVPRLGDRRPPMPLSAGAWLTMDRKGCLWVGSYGGGIGRVLDPRRSSAPTDTPFSPEVEHFTMKDGLLSDVISAVFEDREGNIWVGNAVGLERFREGDFTPVSTGRSARAQNVFATRDSSVWSAGFVETDFVRFGPHGRTTVLTDLVNKTMSMDTLGVPWIVGSDRIARLQRGKFVAVPLRAHEPFHFASVTIDPKGVVWVFDERLGLLRLDHDSLTTVVPMDEIGYPGGQLFSDRQGRIWLGQRDQVGLYDHGTFHLLGKAQGVATGVVHGFLEDRAGHVWIGGGGGLGKFENGRFRVISARRIPDGVLYSPTEDADGAWWIGTRLGVIRLPPGEADRALADSNHVIEFRRFDELDGLAGRMNLTSMEPTVARAADGRIWVAGNDGVASADPRRLHTTTAPPVMIEALRIAGRELRPSAEVVIPAGSRDIEIDYTSTALSTPERIMFRYLLEGEDAEWRDVGARRRAYYSGLAPGVHQFRVTASYGDGRWNETAAVWTLRVLPSWYQTLWFRAAVVLLIAALGGTIAALAQRVRYRRAQAALKSQYEATLAERARIAQDLHDTLLQGFVGVQLQIHAVELALPSQPRLAAETLARVGRLAHESLREARERVWEMRDTSLSAADLPAALETIARDRTAGTGIVFTMKVVGQQRRLARELEDAALRIGREAIVNVIKHADASGIEIEVTFAEQLFTLEVRDDGRGFSLEQSDGARRNGHFGLSGIRDRAAHAGGTAVIRAGKGGGTVVTIVLPVSGHTAR
ncbi:MAG: two-component regulator propeller domain-containing protein [bacterium]